MTVLKFNIPFGNNNNRYSFCYYTDGKARVTDSVSGILLWELIWKNDWTHMIPLNIYNDTLLMFSYKPGVACVDLISTTGSNELTRMEWTSDWRTFEVLHDFENKPLVLKSVKTVGGQTIVAYDEVFTNGLLREFKRVITTH